MEAQKNCQNQIKKILDNFRKSPKDRITKAYIETRLETVNNYWQSFEQRHESLLSTPEAEKIKLPYFTENVYDLTLDLYLDIKTRLKEALNSIEQREYISSRQTETEENIATQQPAVTAKLPPIQLPRFSGDYKDWLSFRDLFTSLVHDNQHISKVNKCQYLKSSLYGEAESLVKQIQVSEVNYDIIWETLNRRYDNRRSIVNAFISKLLNQKKVTTESPKAIKDLLDVTSECLITLRSLELPTQHWDDLVVYIIIQKLDSESHKLFEQRIESNNRLPTWKDLSNFLEHRFRTLEAIKCREYIHTRAIAPTKSFVTEFSSHIKCSYCNSSEHLIFKCKDFCQLNVNDRQDFIQKNNICFNCLRKGHIVKNCIQSTTCRKCDRKHHSLLHGYTVAPAASTSKAQSTQQTHSPVVDNITSLKTSISNCPVILATALVTVQSHRSDNTHMLRALVDQGSQASLITEAACQSLGLKRIPIIGNIVGVNSNRSNVKAFVELDVMSTHDPKVKIRLIAYVLKTLTSYLPQYEHIVDWPILNSLALADKNFRQPGRIDILLGADVYANILQQGVMIYKNEESTLIAQQSKLGWLISGRNTNTTNCQHNIVHTHHLKIDIDTSLRRFWELEEPTHGKRIMTNDEIKCEKHYEHSHKRKEDGRYVVRLPFTAHPPDIGESKTLALKRLTSVESKFKKYPDLQERYNNFMDDYLQQGHMKHVTPSEQDKHSCYLPHHAVINEDHLTTKLRVVFDGSAKTSNGKSLNDNLLIGPPLQNDLRDVTVRWRRNAVVLVADIRQMYRQIDIDPVDTDYQRIVWRFSPSEPIQHFKLTTVTYGTSCAPYLAIKTLKQLAEDERANFSDEVIDTVINNFYVDDLLTGASSLDKAIELKTNLIALLNKGGFSLHKWASNCAIVEETKQPSRQILGINWNSQTDKFELKINIPINDDIVTKRTVLGVIAKIYDPAGWLAPVVVVAKGIMQQLWIDQIEWDQPLIEPTLTKWQSFHQELNDMPVIELDRWFGITDDAIRVELHGFSDASNIAYSAVVYCRTISPNGTKVTIVEAKTKVATVKKISLPRLELCGAVLLSKLLDRLKTSLNVPTNNVYAWTDATIVLAWLQRPPGYWTTFVANRVAEITNVLDKDRWHHVSSQDNPADVASRGISPSELPEHPLWWHGPSWLHTANKIPDEDLSKIVAPTELEKKVSVIVSVHNSVVNGPYSDVNIFDKFSSLNKLVRVTAYCLRFYYKCKSKLNSSIPVNVKNTYLSTEELQNSLYTLLKISQMNSFLEEINTLKKLSCNRNCKSLKRNSKIVKLYPFIDKNDLLKVGGRIQNSDLHEDIKHPVILSKDCKLSYLIVKDAHYKTLHGGLKLMLNYIINKYYIIGVKQLIKKIIRSCIPCCRHRAKLNSQLMGNLPKERVTPQRPFSVSGIDFAGPVTLKLFSGRGSNRTQKAYIALFICTAVKAVHLELVTSLSSEAFIAAFRRFTARRGHCSKLISDCGTNFIGASKELKIAFSNSTATLPTEIADLLAQDGTDWQFNPAGAPHMGGLWESNVKSTKFHLNRVLGDTKLTYEEYSTLLCQIECCLNSRPLTLVEDDHEGTSTALTPGHFLIGEAPILVPEHNPENKISYNDRWIYLQQKLHYFWRKWSQEYLLDLQKRYKWTTAHNNIKVNDIVLVKDDRLPPAKWLLGKIVNTHPGSDGWTRVVTLKCKNSVIQRPIHKLCLLPVNE